MREGRWYAPGLTNGFTGQLTDRYPDGALKSRSAVSNGLLEGLSTGWHTNGQPQIVEHFHAGVSEGVRVKWYLDGQKMSEARILAGRVEGTFRRWHENGQLAGQIEMKAGEPDGVAMAYYPSGSVKARTRANNGKILDQQTWKDGGREIVPPPMAGDDSLPAVASPTARPDGGGR